MIIIAEKRPQPIEIAKEEALIRRLLPSHEKYLKIQESLKKRWSGYRGELNLDYHLSFLPEKDYLFFHNIKLATKNNQTMEMDSLVVSPNFITIIESKNYKGTIHLDSDSKQMIRTHGDEENGFSNPLAQVKRHRHLFQQWIIENKLRTCPVEYLVSISNPSTIIKSDPSTFQRVLHAEHIPEKILELEKIHTKPFLTAYQIQKLTKSLEEGQLKSDFNVLEEYKISTDDLQTGVDCTKCGTRPMSRLYGQWYCEGCGTKSKDAHKRVIEDYIHLYSKITNRECRHLLRIDSIDLAKRLLQIMDLSIIGNGKSTAYQFHE